MALLRLPGSPARSPHPHTTISQPSVHRGRRHAHSFRDPRQRPPGLVKLDRLVDLSGGEPLPPRLDAMTPKDGAHGPAVDTEPVAKLVDRRPGPVVGDELLDLPSPELPGCSWHALVLSDGWACLGIGELPNQRLQLAKQGLRVVVASRLPHPCFPSSAPCTWPETATPSLSMSDFGSRMGADLARLGLLSRQESIQHRQC